ncbi:MAG: sugar phosphate isomerase/epimerase [Planctomycetota bacterium]|nr:sugar phosphate isomerase/epimerase [Planctomycetota bacterium]
MALEICLNTSTLRGHDLGIEELVDIAAEAGYRGIEPWLSELDRYEEGGGVLEDLGRRIRDLGLEVPSAIDFPEWLVDDDARRGQGLEYARRSMERLARLGCGRIAAAPKSVDEPVDLLVAAERYRQLLEIGEEIGVLPVVEFWGGSPAVWRLEQAAAIALAADHPHATVLVDVYHLYKGGSALQALGHLQGDFVGLVHWNDYPADPPRERIDDADRVFPGDGVAPLWTVASLLGRIDYRGMLSLELFHPEYYRRPPREVAREGLRKSKAVLEGGVE